MVVEDGAGANIYHCNEVVVRVHAFSVQPIDRDVLRGRGRRLREFVKPQNKVYLNVKDVNITRFFYAVQ